MARHRPMAAISFEAVPIDKPKDTNVLAGQAHFIKTVEDLHEALATAGPHLRFGLAFSKPPVFAWCAARATTMPSSLSPRTTPSRSGPDTAS